MYPPERMKTKRGLATLIADHLLFPDAMKRYEVSGKFISGKLRENDNFSICIRINTDIPTGNIHPDRTLDWNGANSFLEPHGFVLRTTDGVKNGVLGKMNCEFLIFKDYKIKRKNYAGETESVTKQLEPRALSELADSLGKIIESDKFMSLKKKFPFNKPHGFFERLSVKIQSIFRA